MASRSLKIVSYNSTGLACDRIQFICDFIDKNVPDVVFIQETWLLNTNMGKLNDIHKDYIGMGVSGTPDDELLIGRPRGGVGILWKRAISDSVKFHKIPNTDRACAVTVTTGSEVLLCVNVYLPVDNQSKTRIDHNLLCTFDALDIFIEQCGFRNVILAGDMNVDFKRNNAHDVFVKNYARINDFVCSVNLSTAEKGHTYHDPVNGSFSCIDHFLVSSGLSDCVVYIVRCDYHDNPSKHVPLLMEMCLRNDLLRTADTSRVNTASARPIAWYKVTENDENLYKQKQDRWLSKMKDYQVTECSNVKCCDPAHKTQIDEWFQDMVDCCLLSDQHLPRTAKLKKNKPYWTTEVKPYKDESLWWHKFWQQCGEPKQGVVFENKTEAKKQYMYAVRRYKRKEDQMRKERMAEAISSSKTRDFFREVKKLKPKRASAPCIDGLVSEHQISELFAEKYRTLLNSVPPDSEILAEIRNDINNDCINFLECDRVICEQEIDKALSRLKADKSD